MSAPSIDIRYVAKLARIALTPDEIATYGAQLDNLLSHVAALERLPTGEVPPTAQVIPASNAERDDVVRPSLSREAVLAEAPNRQGPYFRVPRIIAISDDGLRARHDEER
ncbi:MAG: Asp-tRNA(Asn)/Glu-tRNA(Gln) amidotransferase subunit GatC [Candidatus Eremiobacteraeota bacterium]|nr:Asp-tRNA(Asn)/Glu-tRNA(Gln) amidotransferase subunit GatC [Candidatus Eremiobacteraeota bacterium]